jgi:hypothetical protein
LQVAAVLATQATHLSHSSKVTSTSISIRTSSSIRGSFLSSSSSSTVRTTSKEEINTSVRATRQLVFLPQQPTRATKQRQRKEEVMHISTMGNKAINWANHFPKKAAQQQPAPNAPVKQNAMQLGGNNHGQPRAQYGKVNHLEADTVQETPGVALGTFSVEYHSANVLFDTGATHSFVTASWVETHSIPVAPMYPPMRVSSVGG